MKPDWKDCPDWVNWMARDNDGQWRGFENKPIPDETGGYHRPNGGKHVVIQNWTETAVQRPSTATLGGRVG